MCVLSGSQGQQFYCTHCRTLPDSSRKNSTKFSFPQKCTCLSTALPQLAFSDSDFLLRPPVESIPFHCLRPQAEGKSVGVRNWGAEGRKNCIQIPTYTGIVQNWGKFSNFTFQGLLFLICLLGITIVPKAWVVVQST